MCEFKSVGSLLPRDADFVIIQNRSPLITFFSIRKWPGLFENVSGKFSDCHLYIVLSPKCYVFGYQKCPEHLNMAYAEQQWQRMLFGKFGLVGAVLRLMVQRWTHALFV